MDIQIHFRRLFSDFVNFSFIPACLHVGHLLANTVYNLKQVQLLFYRQQYTHRQTDRQKHSSVSLHRQAGSQSQCKTIYQTATSQHSSPETSVFYTGHAVPASIQLHCVLLQAATGNNPGYTSPQVEVIIYRTLFITLHNSPTTLCERLTVCIYSCASVCTVAQTTIDVKKTFQKFLKKTLKNVKNVTKIKKTFVDVE